MRYIVTGGAGFIGSHIVQALAERGDEVVVLDNLFTGRMENIRPFLAQKNVRFVRGSITDIGLLRELFASADGVFHQGAIPSVPRSVADPVATNEANVSGTLNVLVAARDCRVPGVVFASSSSVYGNTAELPKHEGMTPAPLSPYAVSKLAGELYLRVFSDVYGIRTVSLRYFNVFGPRQDPNSQYAAVIPAFIEHVLARRSPTIFGDGEQTRDFTYVRDVVQANIRAMESAAQGVFNVAYCQRTSLQELAALIMEITGITVKITYEPARAGDIRDSLADISRAQAAFGYKPEYTVKSGLLETVDWFRKQSR
jgi:nucleoside-diphosphate-sugar epimerase